MALEGLELDISPGFWNRKMRTKCLLLFLFLNFLSTITASQTTPKDKLMERLKPLQNFADAIPIIAGVLAILMLSWYGLRWVTSTGPKDRAEIKRGGMYVIMGLIIILIAPILVCNIYCQTIRIYDKTISCNILSRHCISTPGSGGGWEGKKCSETCSAPYYGVCVKNEEECNAISGVPSIEGNTWCQNQKLLKLAEGSLCCCTPKGTCEDSDAFVEDGRGNVVPRSFEEQIKIRGTCKDQTGTYTDYCKNDQELVEYICKDDKCVAQNEHIIFWKGVKKCEVGKGRFIIYTS